MRRALGLALGLLLLLPLLALAAAGDFSAHPTTPSFGVGSSFEVALGDLDDDTDLDAVVANSGVQTETVWLNDGAGNFSAHPTTPFFGGENSEDVALGDLDGDSDLDAVVANYSDQAETVWLNDGIGNFSAHPTTPAFGLGGSTEVALGDLDDDTDLDAVVANEADQPETVWLNDGAGNFSAHPTTPSFGLGDSFDVELGDLDGDKDLDAVVANSVDDAETVWLNDGAGNFSAHLTTPSFGAGTSRDVELGDLDGDTDLDAVVANTGVQTETVWLNDGAGNFSAHPTTPSFGMRDSEDVALGDLDGDTDLDAIVANYAEAETVWLNDGTGNFSAHPTTPSFGAGYSRDVALGDLDGDKDLDAVVANSANETETVWLNNGTAAAQLSAFQATAEVDHVRVTWETVSELDNQGFNLYRSTSADEQGERLNTVLIPSEAPNSTEGFAYQWLDNDVEVGTTYYYWLEAVDVNGTTSRFGPASVKVTAPTALTLDTFAAGHGTGRGTSALAALGLTALVGFTIRRRRRAA
jgi:hypothetical protein